MMNCITMRRVLSSPVAKYFLFAFSILIVFCCCCFHPLEAMASTPNYILDSSDPRDWFISRPGQTDSVFIYFSDYEFSNILFYSEALTGPGKVLSGISQYYLPSFSPYGFYHHSDTVPPYSSSLRVALKSSFFNSVSIIDSSSYTVSFSIVSIYNFIHNTVGSFPTFDIVSVGLGQRSASEISYDIWESFSPSSIFDLGNSQFSASFSFVVPGSTLKEMEYWVFDFVNSYPYSGVNTNTFLCFDITKSNYVRLYDPDLDSAEKVASAISGIGSGTPPVDFSGSQSQVNNITSQMGSFDDTYKVDTDQVDQNFTDSLNWLSDGNLTSGFGAVGGWVDRFLSDNKIWMSVITFCLCFGLALFAIGRGVSIGNSQARERNRRNRGR